MDVVGIMNASVVRRTAVLFVPVLAAAAIAAAALPAAAEPGAGNPAEAPASGDAAVTLVAAAQAKLAFSLIEKVAAGGGDDVTLSPASLAAALDLVNIGADPAMKAAIVRVLGFEKVEAGAAALAGVRDRLGSGSGSDSFTFADKLVFAPSHPPGKFLIPGLEKYHVPYEVLDLNSPEGVRQVDDWVKAATQGKIPEILGSPLPKGSLAALNALHFKSRWETPFDPKATQQTAFTGLDGKSADVAMMRLSRGNRAFRQEKAGDHRKEFVAVDLPFSDHRFSLVVATTTAKPAAARDFAPVAEWLSGAGFAPHPGELSLPRFSAAGHDDLLKPLDALGLEKARKSPDALAAFGEGVELSQVTQRTVIEVNEEGAEAAAATAAIATTRALGADDGFIHMVVDKPFVYALRDRTTGLILVAGYVGRPPKATS